MSQGCSEFRASESNLLLQQQERDVGLVEMFLRFLHHSRQGERMSTAVEALLLCFRAPRLAHDPNSAFSQKLPQLSLGSEPAPKHPSN